MNRFSSFVVGWTLLALTGCGGGGPTLYTVVGTVKKKGEPLADVVVVFVPDSPDNNVASEAVTGPDGRYSLTTNDRSGAPAGKYRVSITKLPAASDVPDVFKDDPAMADMAPVDPRQKKKKPKTTNINKLFEGVEIVAGDNAPKDFDVETGGVVPGEPAMVAEPPATP